MIKLIKNWIKVKKFELTIKVKIYESAATLLSEKEEMINLVGRLYVALKDTPTDELQEKFIESLASVVHSSNKE